MKTKNFRIYWLLALLGVLAASYYPLSMGIRVLVDMIRNGTVLAEDYPKYVIPYTPISLAVIVGVLLMPFFLKAARKWALTGTSVLSLGVFFLTELLLESQVLVTTVHTLTVNDSTLTTVELERWQLFICATYVPTELYSESYTTVNALIGEYSPAFKIHFYLISAVLIFSMLNVFYGFGRMIQTGDRKRLKSLILQAVAGGTFLGMCILACFTAFFRTGSIRVSTLSAILMALFFVLFGLTVGIFVGSFLIGRRKGLSVVLPSVISSLVTLAMYMGEMVLLSGHLYQFGTGFFFEPMGGLILAPVDVGIVLLSGILCGLCLVSIRGKKEGSNLHTLSAG